jgi:hypothetical protein
MGMLWYKKLACGIFNISQKVIFFFGPLHFLRDEIESIFSPLLLDLWILLWIRLFQITFLQPATKGDIYNYDTLINFFFDCDTVPCDKQWTAWYASSPVIVPASGSARVYCADPLLSCTIQKNGVSLQYLKKKTMDGDILFTKFCRLHVSWSELEQ